MVGGGDSEGRLVIGLERRTRDDDAEIWLVAECGARRFRFTGTELVSWGPPLAENDDNFAIEAPPVLRAWCHAVKGGWDGGALQAFLEAALAGGVRRRILLRFCGDVRVIWRGRPRCRCMRPAGRFMNFRPG